MSRRRLAARVALATAIIAVLWVGILIVFGGFDTRVYGVRIRTNDPYRPLFLAFAAIILFVASVGDDNADPSMGRVLHLSEGLLSRLDHRVVAVILAATVAIVGLQWGSKAAGGSDSYGYISQAELWANGRLTVNQPWVEQVPWPAAEFTFAPLGYRPGLTRSTIVPTYSAGLPMLMALAKRIAGHCAIFWVVPLAGALLVLATFGIGMQLAGPGVGLVAAWLVATSPPFLFMLVAPLSDVPTAAAWAVTFLCVTRGTFGSALMGGAAAALAVLIRPNLIPMTSLPALWYIFEASRGGAGRRQYLWQCAAFLAALLPGIIITATLNQFWNGSPLTSGYGRVTEIFSLSRILPNAGYYAVWLSRTQTPLVFVGIAALLLPAAWFWPRQVRTSTVRIFGLFVAAIWVEYCAYSTFGAWWDLRFLLPAAPFMMIGTAAALLVWVRKIAVSGTDGTRGRLASLAVGFAVFLLGLHTLTFANREQVFGYQRAETKYPAAAAIVAARTDANAVVFSGLHSGSVRYYAGRNTLVFFNLDPAWLDRAVAWLDAHGAHPYALLEEWEIRDFRNRFSAANGTGRLEMTPLLIYDGATKVYLFDLLPLPGSVTPPDVVADRSPVAQCMGPAPSPSLTLR